MDAFPDHYVDHNLPLLLVSGLEEDSKDARVGEGSRSLLQEGGFRLRTDLPPVHGQAAQELQRAFLEHDASKIPWNGKYVSQADNKICFRINSVGRTFTLPPRKAPPPPHSPRLMPTGGSASPPPPMILHSVLSPLTPSSPLYADGIMSPLWIAKHQSRLPSIFVSIFGLSSDANTSTLLDNKIKTEISNIRSVFSTANYKTKLVVVLVGYVGASVSEMEERVTSIRRASALDSRSLLFLPGDTAPGEVREFTRNLLGSLHSTSIEYYRDLSKHARRKRSRNVVPQPTVQPPPGTSQLLSLRAWNLRYEFKLGIFAEFRQEMDAALRNFEAAYENLFGPDVFEAIPTWSPRFDEARLLADTLAIRIIRCLLWTGQTTTAVKWWSNHRNTIQALVSRRVGGTDTYTWETWQSIWAKTMADLVTRSHILPPTDFDHAELVEKSILVHSEKTLASNDRFAPWESLHHEGYWLNLAQRHTLARRTRAQQMPEEDRVSPGNSPASAIASKAHVYDRYLSLEPHVEYPTSNSPAYDYTGEITRCLDAATQHFSHHSQIRMIHILQLQKAMELMRSALWQDATAVLTPLWQDPMLRKAGWWVILKEITKALWTCAVQSDDHTVLLQMVWERSHPLLAVSDDFQPALLDVLKRAEPRHSPKVNVNLQESLSCMNMQFAFASAECHVGQTIDIQVTLHHLMQKDTRTVRPRELRIDFDGSLKSIYIIDDGVNNSGNDTTTHTLVSDLILKEAEHKSLIIDRQNDNESSTVFVAEADLSLSSGHSKIFQLKVDPREAGESSVTSLMIYIAEEQYAGTIHVAQNTIQSELWWELRQGKAVGRRCGKDRDAAALKILPKPPKLEINVPELQKTYYTNEDVCLNIEFVNGEEEMINGSVDARLISPSKDTARVRWQPQEQEQTEDTLKNSTELVQALPQKTLADVAIGQKLNMAILLDKMQDAVDHELEIAVAYTLPSSPLTLLHKQLTIDLAIIRPFEANFSFHSRYHYETWPCFFSAESTSKGNSQPTGLKQQFAVSALVTSFAMEDIIIKEARLNTSKVLGDATCTITKGTLPAASSSNQPGTTLLHPEQYQNVTFDMVIQKQVLGDRQPVAIDFSLQIDWKRATETTDRYHTSVLHVPRFLAPSSEPRVLLQVVSPTTTSGTSPPNPIYQLTYTLENPSLHFLTFNLTMESSDDFAFSGPKQDSLSLVPISRCAIKYQIMPTYTTNNTNPSKVRETPKPDKDSGIDNSSSNDWLRVHLDVVDAYFGQTLRVQPASDGVRVDKQGNVLIKLV